MLGKHSPTHRDSRCSALVTWTRPEIKPSVAKSSNAPEEAGKTTFYVNLPVFMLITN